MSIPDASHKQKKYLQELSEKAGYPVTMESMIWLDTKEASERITALKNLLDLRGIKKTLETVKAKFGKYSVSLVEFVDRDMKAVDRMVHELEVDVGSRN